MNLLTCFHAALLSSPVLGGVRRGRWLCRPCGVVMMVLMLGALSLGGCGSNRRSDSLESITEAYRAGRFAESGAKAEAFAKDSTGADRDRAALIAGQSAFAMSNRTSAERWLRPLTSNVDPEVAGNANATLGLLAFNERRYAQAAVMLSAATSRLSGDDGARAALYAGDSYEQLGQAVQARASFQRGLQMAQDASLKRSIQDRLVQGPYTIQVGAFQTRQRAEQAQVQHAAAAKRAGLPAPRVVPTTAGPGSQLFAVQIGTFTTRPAAESARARSGLPGAVLSLNRN
jgi:tetratricopeptide (TPR) repeat protein